MMASAIYNIALEISEYIKSQFILYYYCILMFTWLHQR